MTPARAGTSAFAGVLGVVLLLVLVTWAASIGPDEVLRRPGPPAGSSFIPTPTSSQPSGGGGVTPFERRPHEAGPLPWWLRLLAAVPVILAGLLLLRLLARLARHLRELWVNRRPRATRARPEVEFDPFDDAPEVAAALQADAAEQRRLLAEGEPRNAIVACWHRVEVTAEGAGARRRNWQTPSEFVLAVLELVRADGEAVLDLADLYREARFSDHALTEQHRAAALVALDRIQASLARAGGFARPGVRR